MMVSLDLLPSHDSHRSNANRPKLFPQCSDFSSLSPARRSCSHCVMSGRGQRPQDHPHSSAHPPSMPLSNAADSCLMPICPWCILKANHGDEQSATQQAEQAMACFATDARGGHGHFIVRHALKWCQEICASAAGQPAASTATAEQSAGVVVVPGSAGAPGVHSGGASSAASRVQQAATASSASSSQWRPHTPAPLIPDPRFARGRDVGVQGPHPATAVPPPPPPADASQTLTFQVWGGRSTSWLTYEEPIQRQLRTLWATGGGEVQGDISGYTYIIRLTDVDNMEQDRVDTGAPPRKVRIREQDAS